ncbi:MAG: arginine--tRNA ligase [Pseudomonadota bacterium]
MKDQIVELIGRALDALEGVEDRNALPAPEIERTRDAAHGDYASNIAMQLARPLRRSPRDIAAAIVAALPANDLIERTDIAGPGFINFFLSDASTTAVVGRVLDAGDQFGHAEAPTGRKVLVEFVSANPTGPLHVGHGRHAAYGASLANLLRAAGDDVTTEYYVNDAGRQMEILAASVLVRALQVDNEALPLPSAGYRGDYIRDIATDWRKEHLGTLPDPGDLFDSLPDDGPDTGDAYIDAMIARAEALMGDAFLTLKQFSTTAILDDIRDDLGGMGVTFDRFYSEASLETEGRIDDALNALRANGVVDDRDGTLWFRATEFGDEKDRVVVRSNGKKTYFASDIAYHLDKRRRGFDLLLDVLGADHHGYVARVRAGIEAMGEPPESLEARLVQFVSLFRGGEKVAMGTRSGNFVSLRELRDEVGNDAARLFYIMRSNDQHLDFDLELATSTSNENPVYYIQYAHARIAGVFKQLADQGLTWEDAAGRAALGALDNEHAAALMTRLDRFPETVRNAAERRAPNVIVNYLRDLATDLHRFYNEYKFLVDDAQTRNARLTLAAATGQVLRNGLAILGVSAPEHM